jgi:DNA-binding XRE family transcriptional regulator
MVAQLIELAGKQFVILEQAEYERLCGVATRAGDVPWPAMPSLLPSGNYPALPALRSGLARKLIKRRWAVGLSQAELARRAGIRSETLNRIERAKVTADAATVTKIVRVLERAERQQMRAESRIAKPRRRASA